MAAINELRVRVYMRSFVRACKIIDPENHFRNLHLTELVSVLRTYIDTTAKKY